MLSISCCLHCLQGAVPDRSTVRGELQDALSGMADTVASMLEHCGSMVPQQQKQPLLDMLRAASDRLQAAAMGATERDLQATQQPQFVQYLMQTHMQPVLAHVLAEAFGLRAHAVEAQLEVQLAVQNAVDNAPARADRPKLAAAIRSLSASFQQIARTAVGWHVDDHRGLPAAGISQSWGGFSSFPVYAAAYSPAQPASWGSSSEAAYGQAAPQPPPSWGGAPAYSTSSWGGMPAGYGQPQGMVSSSGGRDKCRAWDGSSCMWEQLFGTPCRYKKYHYGGRNTQDPEKVQQLLAMRERRLAQLRSQPAPPTMPAPPGSVAGSKP